MIGHTDGRLLRSEGSLTLIFGKLFSVAERAVSFQITILKVLAGQPEGQASLADLTRYVAVLTSSGADWSQRMKHLAAGAPNLDIFTSGYVLRDGNGWQITYAGREFLKSIEAQAQAVDAGVQPMARSHVTLDSPDLPTNVIQLIGHKVQRRRRAAA